MLYKFLKFPVRLALRIFCRRVEISDPGTLKMQGPLLVVANHPNSFLDAVIIAAHFKKPVFSLARGDAFRKPWHNTLLRMLKMIPVYRLREGKENLGLNDAAFASCEKILERGGIVLIFIEGISINSHMLQPFKKGAARIAIQNRDVDGLQILPLAIHYDSLSRFGKSVCLQTADAIAARSILPSEDEAKNMRYFNEQLFEKLNELIKPAPPYFPSGFLRYIVLLPALMGYLLHFPLYTLVRKMVLSKTKGTIFYDSVLFGALFCAYPLYLALIAILLLLLKAPWFAVIAICILHPVFAWAAVFSFTCKNPENN